MAHRLDSENFTRLAQPGRKTGNQSTASARMFESAVHAAVSERRSAGGPDRFDERREQIAVVEAGDNLSSISEEYNVDLEDLAANNRGVIDNVDVLNVHDVIFLPRRDPVLVAQSERDQDGVPSDEAAFRSDIYEQANDLQYDDAASTGDRDALRLQLAADVSAYLEALPLSERRAAVLRLSGEPADWQDAVLGRQAISEGWEKTFAGDLFSAGNAIEYDEGSIDRDAAMAALERDVEAYLDTVPEIDRGEALQRLFDHDWRDAGPAQMTIEAVAADANMVLRDNSHAGPDIESQARDVIDEARSAGSGEDVVSAYDALYPDQPQAVRDALDRNPEAQRLLTTAEQQADIDTMMADWSTDRHHNGDLIDALEGENAELGALDRDGQEYLIDRYIGFYSDPETSEQMWPMVTALGDYAHMDADTATRELIVERLAHKALDYHEDPLSGDPVYLANAAMRAASGDLTSGAQLSQTETADIQSLIGSMTPEDMATFVSLFGDRDAGSASMSANPTEAKMRLMQALESRPPDETVSAAVQALFANANDALPNEELDRLAGLIAREWHPDDPDLCEEQAERLSGILDTDQGKTLLLQRYNPDDGSLDVNARVEALALIRGEADIDATVLQETDDPWQNPRIAEPFAQDAAAPYLNLRGDTPIVYPGSDLENTIGTAMGAPPVLPEGLSQEEIEQQVADGDLSLYEDADSQHVRDVADAIREVGGDSPAVTVLPVLYSSETIGTVSLPLFRVETPDGPKFVDNLGRDYHDFDAWRTDNQLPPGAMTYPTDGQLTTGSDGQVELSGPVSTPQTVDTFGEHATQILDQAALVGGIVLGGAVILGTGGAATPLVIAGGIAVGGWGAYRAGSQLVDRATHGQSINPIESDEARMLWLDGVASAAGIGAFASAGKLARLTRNNEVLTPGAARVIGTTQALSNTADTAAIINLGHYMSTNWSEMSGEERMSSILSIGFWGTTMGMNMSHEPGFSARTVPDMFNPVAQVRNLTAAYSPRIVDDPSLPGSEICIIDDPQTGGFVIHKGPMATESDFGNHVRVARLMYQNDGLAAQVANVFGRDALTPGTVGYQIKFETEKLAPKLQQLREDLQQPDLSDAERAQIAAELEDYSYFLSSLRQVDGNSAIDAEAIRQPSTGREIALTDGIDGRPDTSSQAAFETYCRENGVDPGSYVWYRQASANGKPDRAALRRADASAGHPELQITTGENGQRIVSARPSGEPAPSALIGNAAEEHAIREFQQRGYTTVLTARNPSGHGVDLFLYNPTTKRYVVAEVKANSSTLSNDQRLGPTYVLDRMRRAADGEGAWAAATPQDRHRAEQALSQIAPSEARPDIDYLVIRYDVDPTTLDVTNPQHIRWGNLEGISQTDDIHDGTPPADLWQLDGPPLMPERPQWQPGDGVP